MLQLILALKALEGSNVEILTEYSSVSGILVEVKPTYIVLRSNSDLFYIPLVSILS
ncbi:YuzF family protein [Ureibacillus chungkukjangi]|uniref:DUF2642 domain-containing protein n=1 Tax=Ureibacillus chungkukjangi TaxID=1202712 RepID=UPI00203EB073|nr:DUF2642 domain-containing protein [Ureibacillus chungkukjangi]MCM3388595.1 YuzF family protein [Ureibacillus chungkukjangi]